MERATKILVHTRPYAWIEEDQWNVERVMFPLKLILMLLFFLFTTANSFE